MTLAVFSRPEIRYGPGNAASEMWGHASLAEMVVLGIRVVILGLVWQLVLFLVLAAVAGPWLWRKYRTRQRRPAIARFASQHGLLDSGDRYVDSPGYDFPLLRELSGSRNGYNNVVAGQWQGLPVKGADYWYSTSTNMSSDIGVADGRNRHYFSIVVADLAATVPYVSVQTKDALTRAFDHVGLPPLPHLGPESLDVIDFEPEEFNQKFEAQNRSDTTGR